MKAVYLCGGVGRRMAPLTTPKFLYPFLGRELLRHHIYCAVEAGIDDFLVVSSPDCERALRSILEDEGVRFDVIIQPEPLGMADAVLRASPHIDEPFILASPNDVVGLESYRRIVQHEGSCLLAQHVRKYFPGGYLTSDGERITGIVEKPQRGREPSSLINIVLHKHTEPKVLFEALRAIPPGDAAYESALDMIFKKGHIYTAVLNPGPWVAIKYPWHILNVMDLFLSTVVSSISEGASIDDSAVIKGPVVICDGVRVLENAVIKGPAYIGPNTVIGNSTLIISSHIGPNCVIGFGSEIKHSYIMEGCWLHHNYIGDSILAENVSFGYGAVTANFRFDQKTVKVEVDGEIVDTGMVKLGAIVGAGTSVGVNASVMPGICISPGSRIYPNTSIGRGDD